MYQTLDSAGLQALLAGENPPRLIDVRGPAEVARGMIPGAQHMDLSAIPTRESELDPKVPLVLYCLSGARSARACAYLEQRGFRHLYHLEGGIAAWTKAGFPVSA
jgi:rhodanese-related sulfurtransferase